MTKCFDDKIATVLEAINNQTAWMEAVHAKVEAERWIAEVETLATNSKASIADLEKQIKSLLEHIDDMDKQGHRCNVRILGVPEGMEGSDPVKLTSYFLIGIISEMSQQGTLSLLLFLETK